MSETIENFGLLPPMGSMRDNYKCRPECLNAGLGDYKLDWT